ncbi:MAG: NAD(+) synthase [Planctomycetota bacterium]|nr:NAD(+) synthase [Planctomycetota bacterium]
MNLVKLGAAVLNQTPLDWDNNRDNIFASIDAARQQGVSVLCLPELCITGYGCEDAFLSGDVCRTALAILRELLDQTRGMVVTFGLPLLHRNGLLNATAVACDGKLAGFVAKQHLAGDGIHYEPRWFKAWPAAAGASEIEIDDVAYPLGNLLFDVGGIRTGLEICEDAWVAQRPGRALSLDAADIILNPSASHFAFGKIEVRKRLVQEGSRAFGVSYVYANLVGNEAGRAIYDGGAMIASGGRLVASGPRLSFKDVDVISAVVDVDATRFAQARTASFAPSLGENLHRVVDVPFVWPKAKLAPARITTAAWETSANVKEEEFARAEALALFDYLRKSRSGGFVVSLSGGADSSAIACLVSTLVHLGVTELRLAGFAQKLKHIRGIEQARTPADLVNRLLTCVYQSTRNSTDTTRAAAAGLAQALNAKYIEFDVDRLTQGYTDMVSAALGRKLAWAGDDIALQNIQARTRGPGVWMIANLANALLLATSNRSEAAVGYATMDGDTCGGLSPIAGIDKAFLRRWLRWMETHGPHGLAPQPALAAVNHQQPTAELRPPGAHQTDEDDLMPYDVLDAVEKAAIRDKLSPIEVFESVAAAYPQHAPRQLGQWVERFFRLWCRNQWKRERYAPSFHLDDENLDPKTWCRFPILSGGYARELAALRERIAGLNR